MLLPKIFKVYLFGNFVYLQPKHKTSIRINKIILWSAFVIGVKFGKRENCDNSRFLFNIVYYFKIVVLKVKILLNFYISHV